jgi:nucleoside-diphosphate-sugar epimerase
MNILVIGGSGFIGPFLVRQLQEQGHRVALFHRGTSAANLAASIERIIGDRRQLGNYEESFTRFKPEVVIDLILSSGTQAQELMKVFRGLARRVVAASSMDVYRAVGVVHGTEPGELEPLPLTEDSALRTKLQTYPPETVRMLQKVFGWLDDEYDKIPVERAVLADAQLPATVLRLPMVYGPGDPLHRFYPVLKRMYDGRAKILLSQQMASWRGPRGYVENVAWAITLAASDERAAGKIYNVAEPQAFSELEWAQKIAEQMGWNGEFLLLSNERLPKYLVQPGNAAQHWVVSSERIRRELGYRESVPLEEAIRRTIAWERNNPPQGATFHQFDYAAEDAALAA